MKKTTYLAALAALALTACSSDSDSVFDQSAADRLEQYKKDYAEVLTAEGGLWTMEYFSNPDEPGYLFIMKFDKDGSVKIGANHKWIGNTYKEETSLWKMIADNGPVLSFNSYNTLFHIFSDPANITGVDAPKGELGDDINETGYGHEGDYEFQIMEVTDEGKTVRLLGKKRLYDIYLRRLDASTDMKAYMDDYKQMSTSLFCKEINMLVFNDADGSAYIVTDAHTGVMNVYPADGDPVDQTRSSNFIITNSGIRFMKPFEIVDAMGQTKEIHEFTFVGNHTLASVDNANSTISAGSITDVFYNSKASWKVDLGASTGFMKDAIDAFIEQLRTLYKYKSANVQEMAFEYDVEQGSYVLRIYLRLGAKNYATDKYYVEFNESDGKLKINLGEAYDQNSQLALNAYTEFGKFLDLLTSAPLAYTTVSDCGPNIIVLGGSDGQLTLNAN